MDKTASQWAFELLRARGQHVCFAESLTGGLIAATLIENAGASEVIDESYVSYSAAAKQRLLGVKQRTVDSVGVFSAQCAREMAEGARRVSRADWGVSATGLAGPAGGTLDTPVGTVFIGIAGRGGTRVFEFHFQGEREAVRRQSVDAALGSLCRVISETEAD